jgi:CubicO group peptidase (beta-lactamase class C family)
VVTDGNVVYARGFGARQFNRAAAVNADTLFQIGSTTKAFTTAALGILVDEGRIRWDDPIIDYLPQFQLQDPWLTRQVTLRDALSHRTGLSDRTSRNFYPFLGLKSQEETVAQVRCVASDARFRDSYSYSNLMYAVAGKVTEVVSGMSWAQWLERRLFEPLRMRRTAASPYHFWDAKDVAPAIFGSAPAGVPGFDRARDSNVAMPHGWNERGEVETIAWQSYDNAAAAGSIVSSAADMANWMLLHVSEGKFDKQQLLKRHTLRELQSTQNWNTGIRLFPFLDNPETYALGWRRAEHRGYAHVSHGGGIIGFPAYVALLPQAGLGVVVLSNGSQETREKVGMYKTALGKSIALWAFDRLLDAPVRDWSQEFLGHAQEAQRQMRAQEEELERARRSHEAQPSPLVQKYVGDYEDVEGCSGRVHVREQNGQLTLSFAGEGAYSAQLEPWQRDLFRLRTGVGVADVLGPQFAGFVIGPRGDVTAMSAFDATLLRKA